jgi:hypothetical protein
MLASAWSCTEHSHFLIGAGQVIREVLFWRGARAPCFGRSGAAGRASCTEWSQHRGSAILIFSGVGRKSEVIRPQRCALIGSLRNRSTVISQ